MALTASADSSILVTGDWLAQHLDDSSVVILHVGSPRDYDAGHIPGARLVQLSDISVTGPTGLRLELPPVADLEKAFGRLGIDNRSRVIVYAGNESVQSATRVWFTLDYLGAGDRAALLDGGISLWRSSGRPVTTSPPNTQPRTFTAHAAPDHVVDAAWVRAHLSDKNVQIIDARLPEFYTGASAGNMPRAGHIPGAASVPYSSLLAADGRLKSPDLLRASVKPSPLTVSYCHIGQQATLVYFVARYLGQPARLYDGSFQDWSRNPDLPVDSPTSSRLDAIFAPLATAQTPGVAVLVRKSGAIVFQRGYGAADLRTHTAIDLQTDFRLASFTKQFTAASILLLVRDGKLTLDRTLTQIFPDFPAYGGAITIRHLLTHTSGLPDYEDLMGNRWTATHQIQDSEVYDLLKHQSSGKFAPGTSWSYSNSAYVMLGLVVAKVSGEPYWQFLRDRIFQPLQMTGTVLYVNGANTVPHRAYGHSRRAGAFVETDQSSSSATQGDGGIYSNLADLAKWDEALDRHILLSEAEMKDALTPVKLSGGRPTMWPAAPGDDNLAPGKPVSYGFGWFLDPYDGHDRMWHFGSSTGFRTAIQRFPNDQLSVIVLTNRTDLDPGKLALEAADVILRSK